MESELALTSRGRDPTLLDYGRLLRRRGLVVALTALLAVIASFAYDGLRADVYTANAELLLTPAFLSSQLELSDSNSAVQTSVDVPTDTALLKSAEIHAAVARTIPKAPAVAIAEVGTTDVVNVSVTAGSARSAAQAANAYATAFVAVRQSQALSALKVATRVVQTLIHTLNLQINSLVNQADAAPDSEQAALRSQIEVLQGQVGDRQAEMAQITYDMSTNVSGAKVISSATVPTSPSAPKPLQYAVVALVAGLLVGFGLIILLEYLRDRERARHARSPGQ
jgi:uncharacterized protein involved in exopolysaccharide biosynthesis